MYMHRNGGARVFYILSLDGLLLMHCMLYMCIDQDIRFNEICSLDDRNWQLYVRSVILTCT